MTTKNKELTDEMVAERLGWVCHKPIETKEIIEIWYQHGNFIGGLPDLINSLDAQAEFLWPKMDPCEIGCIVTFFAQQKRNPAPAIAKAFLELKGDKRNE